VDFIKIFRKLQRQVELKIRHAVATGRLHNMERSSNPGTHPQTELDKADGNGMGHSK
jgi:hypothetical protein